MRYRIKMALLILVLLAGCKAWKKSPKKPEDIEKEKVLTVLKSAEQANLKYRYLEAKISGKYQGRERSLNFKANLRMQKDSVIWISASPGIGFEIARLMITKDSIKMLNRLDKTYIAEKYEAIKELLGANIPFSMLQNLLTGNVPAFNAIYHWNADTLNNMQYVYEKKTEFSDKKYKKPFTQAYWLKPSNYKLTKVQLEQLKPQYRKIVFEYSDFQVAVDKVYPISVKGEIKAGANMLLDMKYKSFETGEIQRFPFRVSSKFSKKEL